MPRARTAAVALSAVALSVLALTACSGGDGSGRGAVVASGDAGACPGDVVEVVVSVAQWGEVVKSLGGDCATVTTVLASPTIDPHDFEVSVSDIAAFSAAQLVVVNGAGYDAWATAAVENLDEQPVLVSAAEVSGLESPGDEHHAGTGTDPTEHAGHGGVDPHLWYAPDVVEQVGAAVSDWLAATSPGAATYFAERKTAWDAEMQGYRDSVDAVRAVAEGHSYAATESVFDRMAAAVGLTDATPEGYRRAASNESDPAPGDLTEFEQALGDGSIDLLIYNTQTSGSIPEQLRAVAEDADVPVVEVTESPPDGVGSFFAWQQAQLEALSEALTGTP